MHKILMSFVVSSVAFLTQAGTLWWQLSDVSQPFDTETKYGGTRDWTEVRVYRTSQLGEWGSEGAAVVTYSYEMLQDFGPNMWSEIDSGYKSSGTTFYAELWNDKWAVARTINTTYDLTSFIANDDLQPEAGTWILTGSSFESVPEPTGGMLVLLGLVALGLRRRTEKRA